MKDDKVLIVALVGIGALYLLMRSRQQAGGGAAYNPLAPNPSLQPSRASVLGQDTGEGTNPITALVTGITGAFSRLLTRAPGNATAQPSKPASVAVSTGVSNTDAMGGYRGAYGYQPGSPLNPTSGETGYLPNLGDPNYAAWDLSTGALGWTLPPDANYIPPPTETGGGVPDLGWTMDPGTLGFDPNAIPAPPSLGGGSYYPTDYPRPGIAITGLEY